MKTDILKTLKNADVYLIGGQSNALGVSKCAELPPEDACYVSKTVLLYQSGAFSGARAIDPEVCGRFMYVRPGLGFKRDTFGLELGMARESEGRDCILLKYACDGSSLFREWRPPSAGETDLPLGGGFTWERGLHGHFAGFIEHVRKGLGILQENGVEARIMGMAWEQGNTDAIYETSANGYCDTLIRLVKDIRAELKAPGLPFAIGRLKADYSIMPFADAVRAAQHTAANSLKNIALVEKDDLSAFDKWHFRAPDEVELGRRYARALRK
ncbi:hypothetical protein FACS1894211_14070 [Clostridia bacterium]|nr:hypothetical protein FACS1894211_14070 [Clostridia bacterium]